MRESQLAIIQWKGAKDPNAAPIAFVGKGVCFDTGGISLKPADGMEEMITDMGGAAAVTGTLAALAGRKATVNAVGILGLVENMPDGAAQRPGDVVTSMSGQTIEVINTDAEGRLVLADALWYCQDRFKPRAMIDLATLTGAIVIALGKDLAGLYCNNEVLAENLLAASKVSRDAPLADALAASVRKTDRKWHRRCEKHRRAARRLDHGRPVPPEVCQRCALGAPRHRLDRLEAALDNSHHPQRRDRFWRTSPRPARRRSLRRLVSSDCKPKAPAKSGSITWNGLGSIGCFRSYSRRRWRAAGARSCGRPRQSVWINSMAYSGPFATRVSFRTASMASISRGASLCSSRKRATIKMKRPLSSPSTGPKQVISQVSSAAC